MSRAVIMAVSRVKTVSAITSLSKRVMHSPLYDVNSSTFPTLKYNVQSLHGFFLSEVTFFHELGARKQWG